MAKINECFEQVGPGWTPLLENLHDMIQSLVPHYDVMQIKEKFGGLRVYLNYPRGFDPREAEDLISLAMAESLCTCEQCGTPGKPGGEYWIKTLCDPCRVKQDAAQKARWEGYEQK